MSIKNRQYRQTAAHTLKYGGVSMVKEDYKVTHVLKNGDVIEETDNISIKVPVNEDTKIFYSFVETVAKAKTA